MKDAVSGVTPEGSDGRSTRWAEHRVARREELITAAMAAIDEHGAEVGLDEIATRAGTSKPVFYRYFSDKDDLLRAVGERVVGSVVQAMRTAGENVDPRTSLRDAIAGYLTLLAEYPNVFRFLNHSRRLTRTGDAVATVLTARLADELTGCGLDPGRAAPWGDAAVAFIRTASLWWLEHPDAMTRDELVDYLEALLWGGAAGVYQSAGRDVDARPAAGVFPARPLKDAR